MAKKQFSPVSFSYGAPMGRADTIPRIIGKAEKLKRENSMGYADTPAGRLAAANTAQKEKEGYTGAPLHLFPLRMDGAYDSGGAYWGVQDTVSGRMYCARNLREGVEIFVRAIDRHAAIAAVTEKLSAATFFPPLSPSPFHPDQKIPAEAWEAAQRRADIAQLRVWVKWIEEDNGAKWPLEKIAPFVKSSGIDTDGMTFGDAKAYALWIACGQIEKIRPGQKSVWVYLGE